jgi:hypothetical protein
MLHITLIGSNISHFMFGFKRIEVSGKFMILRNKELYDRTAYKGLLRK